ncbi:hypothetical protein WAX78_19240 [Bacillus sp. FJAT-53711]|uniref:Uncharacterized protein n=1 Tax=Bacillus yunxiaonensis TaxID=3127665 RepID=A0ABU8G0H2_9BACI
MKSATCLYESLTLELLAEFYYQIHINIEKEILSNAMYQEINLIEQVAIKKGIALDYLYNKGSLVVKAENPTE